MAKGFNEQTAAFGIVNEYIMRKKLSEIGFMASDLKELDGELGMYFVLVSNQIDYEKRKAEEKAAKGTRR